ncbi:MRGRH protein, partial [Bucco capensis]|nr:MRGRH protein [Bucco capensis]
MSMLFSAMARANLACWSQPAGTASNRSCLHHLEDNDYNWTACESAHWSRVTLTLLTCLCGLVGNGAVLWCLSSCALRNPSTIYVLNLAVANLTFLLSITIALVIFYGSESLCHTLGSQDVSTVLNITILFTFSAGVYLLTALSAMTSLSILPLTCCPCHSSWHLPVLTCALLWAFSFLLTISLYFCPAALMLFILSYFFSVLTLVISALTLLARLLCSSQQYPPKKLCVVLLLAVVFFCFLTPDFGYWLLLRLFDFSVFVFAASVPLACVNSSIQPLLYFLVGSCANKFTFSVKVAFQEAFEGIGPQKRGGAPKDHTVQT